MKAKRKSSDTTGPIRIVFFKGSERPKSKQITEKHMIALYTLIGFLIFVILFLSMTIVILSKDKTNVKKRYLTARSEIDRLRKKIRSFNDATNYPPLPMKEAESSNKDVISTKPSRANTFKDTIEENTALSTVPSTATGGKETSEETNPPAEKKTETVDQESPDATGAENNVALSQKKAEISDFRGNLDESTARYQFKYWIINSDETGPVLEGRAVVILKDGADIYTYPWVPVNNGLAEIGRKGILFRIQHRKEMTGEIQLPASVVKIQSATVVLNNLNGLEILKEEISLNP